MHKTRVIAALVMTVMMLSCLGVSAATDIATADGFVSKHQTSWSSSNNNITTKTIVGGKFGKSIDDQSIQIQTVKTLVNGEGVVASQNPWIGPSPAMPVSGVKAGEKFRFRFSVAADEIVSNKRLEVVCNFINDKGDTTKEWSSADEAVGIRSNGEVYLRGAKVGTLALKAKKWYNATLIIEVGKSTSDTEAGVPNKASLYIDGHEYAKDVEFNANPKATNGKMYAVSGFYSTRMHYYHVKEGNPQYYKADTVYWDDVQFTRYGADEAVPDDNVTGITGSWNNENIILTGNDAEVYTTISVADFLAGFSGSNVKSVEYLNNNFETVTEGNVADGYLRITDNSDNVYYGTVTTKKMLKSDNFNGTVNTNSTTPGGATVNKVGSMQVVASNMDVSTIRTVTYHQSYGDKTGIGGKDTDNGVLVIESNMDNATDRRVQATTTDDSGNITAVTKTDTILDPFLDYYPAASKNCVIEASVYTDTLAPAIVLTPWYHNNSGTGVSISGIVFNGGNISVNGKAIAGKTYETGKWYKLVCEFVPNEQKNSSGTVVSNMDMRAYINGEYISTTSFLTTDGVYRMKLYPSYPNEAKSYSGKVAFDDIEIYKGAYDAADDTVSLKSSSASVEKYGKNIFIDSYNTVITASNFADYFNTNGTVKLFDDSSLTTSGAEQYGLGSGNVIVVTSPSGETYEYYNVFVQEDFAGIMDSIFDYSDEDETVAVYPYTKLETFKNNTTFYKNNTVTAVRAAGGAVADNDYLENGDVITVANSDNLTQKYTVTLKYLVNDNFDTWSDTVYNKSVSVPAPWGRAIPGTELETSATISAVEEEGRGKVVKLWSNAETDTDDPKVTNRHMHIYYAPKSGECQNVFVVETDMKVTNNEALTVLTMAWKKNSASSTQFREMLSVGTDGMINVCGNSFPFETGRWYNIKAVMDVAGRTITVYVDGQKLGEESAFSDFKQIDSIRLQSQFKKGVERADYFDNVKIYEIVSADAFDENYNSTEITSGSEYVKVIGKTTAPVINAPCTMTVNELKEVLSANAQLTVLNGSEAANDEDVLTGDMTVKSVAASNSAEIVYTVKPYDVSDVVFTSDETTVTAEVTVAGEEAKPQSAALVIVSYDENGALKNISIAEETAVTVKNISASVAKEGTVKAYVFENIKNIKPLKDKAAVYGG